MRPITKAVFELIYNDNIFHAFREVIPSLRHSKIKAIHCVKSARIPSYSGLYFPAFGLGISSYSVRMREMLTTTTPNEDTVYTLIKVLGINFWKTLVQPDQRLSFCFMRDVFSGF